jgi:hypothetical protein
MKIRDWFHAAGFLFPRDTATSRHRIEDSGPKCHCRYGGEQNHSYSYPETDRGRRGLCRPSQRDFIIMTLSSLDLSAREDSIASEKFLITSFIVTYSVLRHVSSKASSPLSVI